MIEIKDLYDRVGILSRKDQSGYLGPEEFNDLLDLSQELIADYYVQQYNKTRVVDEILSKQVREAVYFNTNRYIDKPSDYRQLLNFSIHYIDDTVTPATKKGPYPVYQYSSDEDVISESSSIRGSSLSENRFCFENIGNQFKLYPETFIGRVDLKYLKYPDAAQIQFTVDDDDNQILDTANTVNLNDWPKRSINDFLDVMLLFKGISTRESELINYVRVKQGSVLPENVRISNQRQQ